VRSERRFTVIRHVDERVEDKLRHDFEIGKKCEGVRENEGREREGGERMGEKEIKRGRLGGGGARGRGVVCSYAVNGRSELSPRRSPLRSGEDQARRSRPTSPPPFPREGESISICPFQATDSDNTLFIPEALS
jgi:hypothetical protein